MDQIDAAFGINVLLSFCDSVSFQSVCYGYHKHCPFGKIISIFTLEQGFFYSWCKFLMEKAENLCSAGKMSISPGHNTFDP